MRETFEHEYPPLAWDAPGITAALQAADGHPVLPTYDDESQWRAMRDDPVTAEAVNRLLERAEEGLDEPTPALSASEYLAYHRTGNRTGYQYPYRERRQRLGAFTLAACLTRDDRYLDAVLDEAWALCEQTTWVLPAHLREPHLHTGLPGLVDPEDRTIALLSAEMSQLLAEVSYVLGDQLHPALHERIRAEIESRVLSPYEARTDHRWMQRPCNNWNAVCNGSIATASLYLLDDLDRVGHILKRAIHSLHDYLGSFDPDGCTPEGMDYWNYGMSHFIFLAAELEARTEGALSLVTAPILEQIAQFPIDIELSPGHPVPFSDAFQSEWVMPHAAVWLGERLENDALAIRGRHALAHDRWVRDLREPARAFLWSARGDRRSELPPPPTRIYYPTAQWWIVRADPSDPDTFAVAAKGGHNAESHNHNDLGGFVLHLAGESPLTDLGLPSYDRGYFSSDRYEYLTARSLGHSVPYVNETEQANGRAFAASVTAVSEADDPPRFEVDLTDAYPDDAALASLVRSIDVDLATPKIRLTDDVEFAETGGQFASNLVSYFPMRETGDQVIIDGDRTTTTVEVDRPATIAIDHLPKAVRDRDVWRASIELDTLDRCDALQLEITPTVQ